MPNSKSHPQKRRRRSIVAFEMIRLDRTATEPLHLQLYRQIRDELKSGRFSDGSSRLPSSRVLAVDLGISRSTATLAFSKLHAEGYLRSSPRSGTFIANVLPETFLTVDRPKAYQPIKRPIHRLRECLQRARRLLLRRLPRDQIDFRRAHQELLSRDRRCELGA